MDKRRALSAKEDELKSWLNWKSSILADKAFCIGGWLSTETTSDGETEELNFPIAEVRCKLERELKSEEQREAMLAAAA